MFIADHTEGRHAGFVISDARLKPAVSSRARKWDGVAVDLFRVCRGGMITATYPEHVVWLQLRGATKCLFHYNGQILQRATQPGDVTIAPVGHCTTWQHEDDKDAEIVALCLAPSFVQKIVKDANASACSQAEILPHFGVRDAFIEDLAARLLGELMFEGYAGRAYVNSVATLLCIHLLRVYSNAATSAAGAPPALSRHKLRRATDYINDNLRSELTVDAIARHVLMGRFRFAHLFKDSTGVAPHQYVTKVRIERAKLLLRETDMPVTAIGREVGYTTQSHFSMVFRRFTGSTPRGYRSMES